MSGKAKLKVADWYFDSAEYDAENDVLYLSIGEPRPGYGEETPEGHVVRFDQEGEFCGLTLFDVQSTLEDGKYVHVSVPPKVADKHTWVPSQDLKKVLA